MRNDSSLASLMMQEIKKNIGHFTAAQAVSIIESLKGKGAKTLALPLSELIIHKDRSGGTRYFKNPNYLAILMRFFQKNELLRKGLGDIL